MQKMDLEQLEKLRLMNQNLLKQLKENQEEFRRCLHGKSLPPSLQTKIEGLKTRQVSDPQMGKEKQGQALEDLGSIAMRTPREAGAPSEPTMSHKEEEGEIVHQVCPHPGSCWIDKTSVPPVKEGVSAQAAGKIVKNGNFLRDPERKSITVSPREAEMHPAPEGDGVISGVESKQERAEGSRGPIVSARMPQAPKSILLTPPCKETKGKPKKQTGRVTFVSDPEEYILTPDEWSVHPFLGYDWIAGLLDMESSVSEKPEQYFSELQDFRKVNKDACIYDGCLRSEARGSWVLDQQSEAEAPSHQCIFCYHLNKRLFAVPLDSETACPICKTPRAQQPPETLVEPVFVRVSIPRSTLLPAYKHKIHRRKSYEPADDLALPSHCLAGWENPIQASSPTLSSLDLRTTLAAKPSGPLEGVCALATEGGTSLCEGRRPQNVAVAGENQVHWSHWEPWICMCNLHKQARIRHFVVWATRVTPNLGPSEFWEEKPCSLQECTTCMPEECPGSPMRSGLTPPSESFLPTDPHDSEIPLPPSLDSESYDSLPVVDDVGQE